MIRQGLNGFLMALADSVPGVSGGTVAFIMGFYDNFIGAIDDLMRGNRVQKKAAAKYLAKLGIGWAIGMVLAVLTLALAYPAAGSYVPSVVPEAGDSRELWRLFADRH